MSDNAILLTTFELVVDAEEEEIEKELFSFLKKFQGLRDLYLLIPGAVEWASIGQGILNHKSTLRRLVMHERIFEVDGDVCDGEIIWGKEVESIAGEWNLQCLGTSNKIDFLVSPILVCSDRC